MSKLIKFPNRKQIDRKASLEEEFEKETILFFQEQKKYETLRIISIVGILILAIALTILVPLWISFYLSKIIPTIFF